MVNPSSPEESSTFQPESTVIGSTGGQSTGALVEPDLVNVSFGASVLRALGADQHVLQSVVLREAEGEETALYSPAPDQGELPDRPTTQERLVMQSEIARGGMGAVWKGADNDLGREVAVKVLLQTRNGQTKLLQRFVDEARIHGQLQHPGVAPVYEMGQFPDKRPYFTMKLIRGQTLSRLLSGRPNPGHDRPRFLKIFEKVCQTLAYAHARGVIHRDLKPANVMVGSFGETLVVDWGLAKCVGPTVSGSTDAGDSQREAGVPADLCDADLSNPVSGTQEPGLTTAGQVVGTPAYMSPEQARGETNLGPATDVYGLGAILYEILTGLAPYRGTSATDVLAQVLAGPPPPPSSCVTGIPRALGAICLKAMARDSSDRYRTATELAHDIDRWLGDEPVAACVDSWLVQAGRWTRRHRTGVLIAVATVSVATICLAVTSMLLLQANLSIERQRNLAQVQRDKARVSFQLAREAVDNFHTRVSESAELKSRGLELLRHELLDSAAEFYQRFVDDEAGDARVQNERGLALLRLGALNDSLGRRDKAVQNFQQARDIFGELIRAEPNRYENHAGLADAHRFLGKLHRSAGQTNEGELAFRTAITLGMEQLERAPHEWSLVRAVAAARQELGILYFDTRRADEAAREYKLASEGYRLLVERYPKERSYRQDLAAVLMDLGVLYVQRAQHDLAEVPYLEALRLNEELVESHPGDPEYAAGLATTWQSLGILRVRSAPNEARDALQRAFDTFRRLAEEHPRVVNYQLSLMQAGNNLGVHLRSFGLDEQARPYYQTTCDTLQRLADSFPDDQNFAVYLGVGLCNNGNLLRDVGEYAQALETYSRARQILQRVLAREPRQVLANQALPLIHGGEALTLARLGRSTQADEAMETALRLCDGPPPAEVCYDRALILGLTGRHQSAATLAIQTADDPAVTPREMTGLAAACSLASAAALHDLQLTAQQQSDLHEQYGHQAVELLRRAQGLGQFKSPATLERMRQEPDFAPLQARTDFLDFVNSLEQANVAPRQRD
ncbi:MAG: protein kinase [Planctomycetia bacterium]|nr:protein kinase [Planctomycetia bacterium]